MAGNDDRMAFKWMLDRIGIILLLLIPVAFQVVLPLATKLPLRYDKSDLFLDVVCFIMLANPILDAILRGKKDAKLANIICTSMVRLAGSAFVLISVIKGWWILDWRGVGFVLVWCTLSVALWVKAIKFPGQVNQA